jgi:stage V sporulation protein B
MYLGRTLGPARYGVFGVVMALLVWFEVSLTGAFPYAIRKFGAENRARMQDIAATALAGQFIYASALFLAAQLLAPWIAIMLGDPAMTFLIRIALLDIPVYAAYFCYLGVLNGNGNFGRQAAAVMIYSGSKLAAMVGLVALGYGVNGALVGNAAASVFGLAAARLLSGPVHSEHRFPMGQIVKYVAGTALLAIVYTLLINLDVFVAKSMVQSGRDVGAYVAAAALAKAPFFLFIAIANVTLPSVSRALAQKDRVLLKTYVRQSFRLHLMLLMPLTAVVSAGASGIVELVYQSGYSSAALPLSILICAYMFWGLLNGIFNLMVADQQTGFPVVFTVFLVVFLIMLSLVLVPIWGITGAAVSAAIASMLGLIVASVVAYRHFEALISVKSLLRIVFASASAYAFTAYFKAEGMLLAAVLSAAFALYAFILLASKEVTGQDLLRITGRRREDKVEGSAC